MSKANGGRKQPVASRQNRQLPRRTCPVCKHSVATREHGRGRVIDWHKPDGRFEGPSCRGSGLAV
jgi:hypothetical protein